MKPNTSAILVIVEDRGAEQLINRMAPYQAQVVTLAVGDETSGAIMQAVAADVSAPGQDAPKADAPKADAPKA
jgi:hypothetical protein